MRRVTVTELKNQLSRYLRLVKHGETVEILERSVPIARIQAIASTVGRGDAQLESLVRDGIVARAQRKAAPRLPPPAVKCQRDIVEVLIEERGER